MKKIMFSDKYGLTDAVLQGRKTMTRRIISNLSDFDPRQDWMHWSENGKANVAIISNETYKCSIYPLYQPGEVVAVAQSYKDLGYTKEWVERHISPNPNAKPTDPFEKKYPGWNNKMFVRADLMPHQIRITDIKVERLQVISDEDCFKEGLMKMFWGYCCEYHDRHGRSFKGSDSIRDAFADLIDGISGKGTWALNPFVFAYTFELLPNKMKNNQNCKKNDK